MTLIAWVNGHFLPLEKATVHIEDRGFQFADGVYEETVGTGQPGPVAILLRQEMLKAFNALKWSVSQT